MDTMIDALQSAAAEAPDRTFCVFEQRRTIFADFFDRVRRVAAGLQAFGLAKDQRIAFLGKNSDRALEVVYGGAMALHPAAVINWRLALPEWIDIVRDTGSTVLFADGEYLTQALEVTKALPVIRQVIVIDGPAQRPDAPTLDYDTWLEACSPLQTWAISADDDFLQLYTSGTTGRPKGVRLTHANYASLVEQWCVLIGPPPSDENLLIFMPFFHASGITFPILAVRYRTSVEIQRAPDADRIFQALESGRVTAMVMVPTLIGMLVPKASAGAYPKLRRIYYGASTIDAPLLERAMAVFDCEFVQIYGATETTAALTLLSPDDHRRGGHYITSAGRFCSLSQVHLTSPEGTRLPPGETGEVWVRSASIMKGYWNNPDATRDAIVDGWYRTGDVGRVDDEGYLYIVDRAKDMIVSGGENVYSAEVENVLAAHPHVKEVAVVASPDAHWGEIVTACIVPHPGHDMTLEGLREFARERLAGYKLPRRLVLLDALPRNPLGKVLKGTLRTQMKQGAPA
ncbi:MAG: AMP-binding protein [Hydrogenophaga sp.]|uniref:AMP-binding protein n=1 Tax=Hydrogenophaga sp. TaxID=1904254 RepID=UPI00262F2BDE|nr:AMP-binding protein [Hydrogenophaga sp.]MCW5668702.1 AMP-binding protein [Hydrogenophaga sp.]